MSRPAFDTPADVVPPACRPTVDRMHLALDGVLPAESLDADPHPAACAPCRERIGAARVLLSVLAAPAEPVRLPAGLADGILGAVRADRRARNRRRVFAFAGGLAVAAAVAVAVWLRGTTDSASASGLLAGLTVPAAPTPEPAPEPRPVRLGSEFTKASQHLRDSLDPITEPAAAAPQVFSKLGEVLSRPMGPVVEPEPARVALAEIPDAARAGLEPVTGTAQKAFARLLRDIGGVQITPKPKL